MSPEPGALSIDELKVELDGLLQKLQLRRSDRLRQKRLREERDADERETLLACEYRAKQLAAMCRRWRAPQGAGGVDGRLLGAQGPRGPSQERVLVRFVPRVTLCPNCCGRAPL